MSIILPRYKSPSDLSGEFEAPRLGLHVRTFVLRWNDARDISRQALVGLLQGDIIGQEQFDDVVYAHLTEKKVSWSYSLSTYGIHSYQNLVHLLGIAEPDMLVEYDNDDMYIWKATVDDVAKVFHISHEQATLLLEGHD